MMDTTREYISATDTAKLVRKALRKAWPAVRFSVRTDTYAGGASLRVKWTDGPTAREVDGLVSAYCGAGFDGMTDYRYSRQAWLHADGTVTFAQTEGTESQRGPVAAHYAAPNDPSARLVQFGAHYIKTTRELSADFLAAARSILPMHSRPFNYKPNGGRDSCFACGVWLPVDEPAAIVTTEGNGWGRPWYCGKAECGAKVLAHRGVVRPKAARRAVVA